MSVGREPLTAIPIAVLPPGDPSAGPDLQLGIRPVMSTRPRAFSCKCSGRYLPAFHKVTLHESASSRYLTVWTRFQRLTGTYLPDIRLIEREDEGINGLFQCAFSCALVSTGVGVTSNCGPETLRWLRLDDEEGVNRHSCLIVSTWRSGD